MIGKDLLLKKYKQTVSFLQNLSKTDRMMPGLKGQKAVYCEAIRRHHRMSKKLGNPHNKVEKIIE